MRRYQAAVVEVIEKHGGYLANWLGDGAIAYFGWPSAGEDQAVRAVQAGIGATAAVGRLPLLEGSTEMLAARVGITTGQVVVGDLEDGEVGSRGMVTGETPNLAARLQGAAEPGSVVIGQTTRALVRAGFTLDFLGPLELKGFNAPVDAWSVIAEQASSDRFETSDRRLTTFTGRMHEVGLLLDRWNQAGEGEGQVAVISGEPGIGKSRIVQTFRDRIENDPHNPVVFQCTPHHLNSALYPIIRRLEQVAGIVTGDAPDQTLTGWNLFYGARPSTSPRRRRSLPRYCRSHSKIDTARWKSLLIISAWQHYGHYRTSFSPLRGTNQCSSFWRMRTGSTQPRWN
jgi:hypothetical protein